MQAAGANENGAINGFAGIGMMGGIGQTNIAGLMQQGQQQAKAPSHVQIPTSNQWTCSCGVVNTGNFCTNCGARKPSDTCRNCGYQLMSGQKFCPNCGSKVD